MTAEQAKLKRRGEQLYERYGKPLEAHHAGKFVAITPQGETIIGDTMLEVAKRAAAEFGHGNFVVKQRYGLRQMRSSTSRVCSANRPEGEAAAVDEVLGRVGLERRVY